MTARSVAVVGAGIAGLAAARALQAGGLDVAVLDAAARVGGLVETERIDGFSIEHGPDSLVTHDSAGVDLARALGLESRFVTGASTTRRAFMARGDTLQPLPPALLAMSPRTALALLVSSLLSARGKMRFLAEPFVARRREQRDESVASFFTRRFGNEMAANLVEPMLRGIYVTPTGELSMHAAMPRLAALERSAGSVGLGVLLARLRRTHDLPGAISFRSGMAELTEALAASLGDRVRLNTAVRSVARGPGHALRLMTADGAAQDVDAVTIAVPAWAAAEMVRSLDDQLADLLGQIEYAPSFSMSLAFPHEQLPHPMDGTGFLVAPGERRFITACTWSSKKWPGCAPDGWALLRVFATETDIPDAEATQRVRADLHELMGIRSAPAMLRIRRHSRLMPQRRVGHLDLVARIEERAAQLGPITLAGNALGAIGIPACIASGVAAARNLRDSSTAD